MAFKSSKGRDVGKELKSYQSSQLGQGFGGGGATGNVYPLAAATGGTIVADEIDIANETRTTTHVFSAPGTFTMGVPSVSVDYLVVGGGGSGGAENTQGTDGGLSRFQGPDISTVTANGGGGGAGCGSAGGSERPRRRSRGTDECRTRR